MVEPERKRTQRGAMVGEALLHPVCLMALGLWWLNDDVLKWRFHNWWTGKLSDVCCMIVFPVLVISVIQGLSAWRGEVWLPRRWQVLATLLAVGGVFAAINLFPEAVPLYRSVFAHVLYPFLALFQDAVMLPSIRHTLDPSDLLTLPLLGVAYRLIPQAR